MVAFLDSIELLFQHPPNVTMPIGLSCNILRGGGIEMEISTPSASNEKPTV